MQNIFVTLLLISLLSGCGVAGSAAPDNSASGSVITITDCALRTVSLQKTPQKVIALSSSFAEIWLLSGGTLSGVTNDAITERELGLPEDISVVGTVKDPNTEILLSELPDFVILSEDIASHISISEILTKTNIPHYIAKVETLEDYLKVLGDFTKITGDTNSLYQNGDSVRDEVELLLSQLPLSAPEKPITALFLRAYSSDIRVKARDHTVCYILDDILVENIAVRDGFPLEELSVEAILEADPDYIFIVAMGDENAAKNYLDKVLLTSPAWKSLSAVQNSNIIMLPKALYHYKPNNRWGEAYEYLLQIIYPEIYAKE